MAVIKGGFDGLLSLVLCILICMCVLEEVFWGFDDFWPPGILFWSFDLREVCLQRVGMCVLRVV